MITATLALMPPLLLALPAMMGITYKMERIHALYFALLANIIGLVYKYKNATFVMLLVTNALIHPQRALHVYLFQQIITSIIILVSHNVQMDTKIIQILLFVTSVL